MLVSGQISSGMTSIMHFGSVMIGDSLNQHADQQQWYQACALLVPMSLDLACGGKGALRPRYPPGMGALTCQHHKRSRRSAASHQDGKAGQPHKLSGVRTIHLHFTGFSMVGTCAIRHQQVSACVSQNTGTCREWHKGTAHEAGRRKGGGAPRGDSVARASCSCWKSSVS